MTKKPANLSGTPNLKQLLREARRLNCIIAKVNSTGEIRVTSPYGIVTLNARRKQGNNALISILRKMQEQENAHRD